MDWYWIVLIIIVYAFGIGVSGAIFEREGEDVVVGFILGMVWPVWMIAYLGYKIFRKKE